jgi:hypothetical protein
MASQTEGTVTRKLGAQLAITSQTADFPLPLLAGGLNQPDISLQYVGLESLDGTSAHHIHLSNTFASRSALQSLSRFSDQDIWIDAGSGLVRKVSFTMRAAAGQGAPSTLMEIEFSDYRAVNGVQYPFEIKKSMNGTPWTTITIQTVTFNNGLSDADFQVQ